MNKGFACFPVALLAVLAMGCSRTTPESAGSSAPAAAAALRVGLVVKALGNGFFDAVNKGANEAAKALGGVKVIYTGPTSNTAEGQIAIVDALIAQHVDAIAISADDPDALVPTLKKAMSRGIKVISFDSSVASGGRIVHLAPSADAAIGDICIQMAAAAAPDGKGKIAILSSTPTMTNQNIWIEAMKVSLHKYPALDLVATVYGDELADKSYRETVALLKRFPDLRVIVVPTSVGIVAAAKAVEDQGAIGKVFVTGIGLPSELVGHVKAGSVKSFAIWNPIDLGYATVELAVAAARGASVGPGAAVPVGRLGQVSFDADGIGAMGKPSVFDSANVEEYAKLF
jgi:rhamnose transport system substrate-binding protein